MCGGYDYSQEKYKPMPKLAKDNGPYVFDADNKVVRDKDYTIVAMSYESADGDDAVIANALNYWFGHEVPDAAPAQR